MDLIIKMLATIIHQHFESSTSDLCSAY